MEILNTYRLPLSPQWNGELSSCVVCHRVDKPLYVGEADAQGQPIFDHDVVVDLTFLYRRSSITREEKSKGWTFIIVDDKPAKVRHICRTCLQVDSDTEDIWRDWKKQREQEQNPDEGPSFYYLMCSE